MKWPWTRRPPQSSCPSERAFEAGDKLHYSPPTRSRRAASQPSPPASLSIALISVPIGSRARGAWCAAESREPVAPSAPAKMPQAPQRTRKHPWGDWRGRGGQGGSRAGPMRKERRALRLRSRARRISISTRRIRGAPSNRYLRESSGIFASASSYSAERQGQGWSPTADGVGLVSARIGGLPFAESSGSALAFLVITGTGPLPCQSKETRRRTGSNAQIWSAPS